MKKEPLKIFLYILCFSFVFTSCKKEDPEPEETPVNTTPPIFKWKINNTTSYSSDSTYCYPGFGDIYAFRNGLTNNVTVQLSSLGAGTYSISPATGNGLTLVAGSTTANATTGQVSITSSDNSKISGTLSVAFSSGTITSLTGEFTDVPKRN